MFADISFPISSFQVFSYKIPDQLVNSIFVGSTVNAPLGKRIVSGIIVNCYSKKKFDGKIKEIKSLVDGKPVLDDNLWKLISWLSAYYNTPIGLAAKAVIPSQLSTNYEQKKQSFAKVTGFKNETIIKGEIQLKIFNFLKSQDSLVPISELKTFSANPSAVCKSLQSKGLIKIIEKPVIPNIYNMSLESLPKKISITIRNLIPHIFFESL